MNSSGIAQAKRGTHTSHDCSPTIAGGILEKVSGELMGEREMMGEREISSRWGISPGDRVVTIVHIKF